MRRGKLLTAVVSVAGLLVVVGPVSALAADSPVPGTPPGVSAGTQPASASIGNSAGVASNRTSSTADGQGASHSSCGAGIGAAGNSFGTQPAQVGTSGASAPPACSSGTTESGAGQGIATSSTAQNRGAGASSGASTSTGLAAQRQATENGSWLASNAGRLGWLFLALLLACLFFLFGAAATRRRSTPESA